MMASQSSRPAKSVRPIPQRARRIPDEEWETWKEKLVKLFIEDDVPRKEIIAIMAAEHHFIITDVQLKNRFKKWDVKKYIPDDDLRIMLSLKRKRQSVGKDARFEYKGHDVEQERMERAWKRQKGPLLSPEFVPPYIKMHTSRQHSPQDASASLDSAPEGLDMPLLELYYTRESPSTSFHNPSDFNFVDFEFDFNFSTPRAVQEPDDHSVIHPSQSLGGLVMAEAPVIAPLQPESRNFWGDVIPQSSSDMAMAEAATAAPLQSENTDFWRDVIPSTEVQFEHSGIGSRVLQEDEFCEHLSTNQLSRASSHVSSEDWRKYINDSPSMHLSLLAPATASRSPRYPSRPLSTISSRTQSSPRATLHDNLNRASSKRHSSRSMTSQRTGRRVIFPTSNGADPESIMLPLQLLYSSYIELAQSDWRTCWDPFIPSSTLDLLDSTLHSDWLSLEMEELICQSYEISAQAIRRRQAARPVSSNENNLLLALEDDREREASGTEHQPTGDRDSESILKMKLTSRTARSTSTGRLIVEFRAPSRESPHVNTSDVPCGVNMSFIPRSQDRTIGISAVFLSAPQGYRISPRLRTFNVIPDDSLVIEYIWRNDVSGVQRLFSEGEASPLDVDSQGFSLLSYAMDHRSTDMFRLLLEGGACTQNCNSFNNTIDIIWAIWSNFTEDNTCRVRPLDRTAFDTGVKMTHLALEHGCDIEETVSYNKIYANALSHVNDWSWSRAHPMLPIETLEFLLNIGYDLEQQNTDGLTSLLHAAAQHMPRTIKCLRLFIERGADPHATDFEGRGVLHCALAAPDIYGDWSGTLNDAYATSPNPLTNETDRAAQICYNTEDRDHEEDYNVEGANTGRVPEDIIDNASYYEADEYSIDYIFCENDHGDLERIRNPMQVLKRRTMFKLLTLLQLGCDPNVVDHQGLSPSDYAMRDGLWPQWRWALLNAGYIHHRKNGWVKSSLTAPV